MSECKDCKTCTHATILYSRTKDNRFSDVYAPVGWVRCAGPRYKGRAFFCKDNRAACDDYARREREVKP